MIRRPIIRVFVSSPFGDLELERNALHEHVFRPLANLCTEHDFEFRAIDLRWGVPDGASLDQRTMEICFRELERSQRLSPKPNFVVLLGDRYGWQPLPRQIQDEEFQVLAAAASDHPMVAGLLSQWYERDDNARPAAYFLRPRHGTAYDSVKSTLRWHEEVERPLIELFMRSRGSLDLLGRRKADGREMEHDAWNQQQQLKTRITGLLDAKSLVATQAEWNPTTDTISDQASCIVSLGLCLVSHY